MAPSASPLSLSFTRFLAALDDHIACTRDLADVDPFDTACRRWLDDSEPWQSWNTVRTIVSGVTLALAGIDILASSPRAA